MQYYDSKAGAILAEREISRRGLTAEGLAALGIFPIREILPEFDGRYYRAVPGEVEKAEGGYVRRHAARPLPLPFVRAAKKEDVTALRWERETGGITLPDGTRVLTGIDDQNRIATAMRGMEVSGLERVDFKAASGWTELTAAEIGAVAAAMSRHVQACFSRERELHALIDGMEDAEAVIALDITAGWPDGAVSIRPDREIPNGGPEPDTDGAGGSDV